MTCSTVIRNFSESQIDSKKIAAIAVGTGDEDSSLIKIWCKTDTVYRAINQTVNRTVEVGGANQTVTATTEMMVKETINVEKCE